MPKAAAAKLARRNTGPHLRFERELEGPVCGIDEVGRAPLAGPVVAACVYIPEDCANARFWSKVRDSKRVPQPLREELHALITERACFGIGESTVEEIDEINIHYASLLAMHRAHQAMVENFSVTPVLALIDGRFKPAQLTCDGRAIIGGDDISRSIAAASIVAKVHRDRLMRELHGEHPHYGWDTNVGYPTPDHRAGLKQYGLTRHHRRSFGLVKELYQAARLADLAAA